MPESYLEVIVTWPTFTYGPAKYRETRLGKTDAEGNVIWGSWNQISLIEWGGQTNAPASQTIRNYHGRKILAEVRDLESLLVVGPSTITEYTMYDNIPPMAPGSITVTKEVNNGPPQTVKVTLKFPDPIDWQLVVSRRVKIYKNGSFGPTLISNDIVSVAQNLWVIGPLPPINEEYQVQMSYIDNHGNEGSYISANYNLNVPPNVPPAPPAPTVSGLAQVPGPEFGGQP